MSVQDSSTNLIYTAVVCGWYSAVQTHWEWPMTFLASIDATRRNYWSLPGNVTTHQLTLGWMVCPYLRSSNSYYLGVTLSTSLSWATHTKFVWAEAKWHIGLLHRNASPFCKAQLYKSLVLPTLNYCSSFGIQTMLLMSTSGNQ